MIDKYYSNISAKCDYIFLFDKENLQIDFYDSDLVYVNTLKLNVDYHSLFLSKILTCKDNL